MPICNTGANGDGCYVSEDLVWPFVYANRRVFTLERSETPADAFFGGPFELEIVGRQDRLHLHRTLTLSASRLNWPEQRELFGKIPLLYGFQYGQNQLSYRLHGAEIPQQGTQLRERIHDVSLDASTYDADWPYVSYPPLLPYIHLRIASERDISLSEFCSSYIEAEVNCAEDVVIVGVPTNHTLGYSMWGLEGDQQGILLLFVLDVKTLRVTAWHRLP
jgi:hypothetical protein